MLRSSKSKSSMIQKYFILFFIPIIFYQSNISAQAKETSDSTLIHTSGAQAFEFYLLNEQSISYKRYVSDSWLVKFNINLSGVINSIERNEEYIYQEFIDERNVNYKYSESAIGLSIQLFNHIVKNEYLNLIIGLGPLIKIGHHEYESNNSSNGYIYNSSNYSNYYGVLATAYLEVTITRNIFLLLKYDLTAQYLDYKYQQFDFTNNNYSERSYNTYRWDLETSGLRLGVGIYF